MSTLAPPLPPPPDPNRPGNRNRLVWRPHRASLPELAFLALCAVGLVALVELWPRNEPEVDAPRRRAAAELAARAFVTVRAARAELTARDPEHHPAPDPRTDPLGTGLIGVESSVITSSPGSLTAKQTTQNPNFAAAVVRDFTAMGLGPGDVIAVGVSGSLPSLNIAVYAACTALELDCLVIASATASQYGANLPELTWIDMERYLGKAGVFRIRSLAVSRGGLRDRALGIGEEGLVQLHNAIERNDLRFIESPTIAQAVSRRMEIYLEAARGRPIKAYVNVGGGTASVGSTLGKGMYKPGINRSPPVANVPVPAVMDEFARVHRVPVLHLTNIVRLARTAGLPHPPTEMPVVGEGSLYTRAHYHRGLAAAAALVLLGLLMLIVRTDGGHWLARRLGRSKPPPEPMI